MRPLVTGTLYCSSQNNANSVSNTISNRIGNGQMQNFELTEPVTAAPWHNGLFYVNFSLLAETAVDRDTLFAFVVDTWTQGGQANRILSGSTIKRTNNYDDEGLGRPDEVLETAIKP